MTFFFRLSGALALLFVSLPVGAQDTPYLPCDGEPDPPHAAVGAAPNIRVITQEGYVWDAPRCSGWGKGKYALLIAVAARFEHTGGVDAIVRKFSKISALRNVRYWSTSAQAWRDLFGTAYALGQTQKEAKRADFEPKDLVPGPVRHFWAEERGPVGGAIFRLRVLERTPERLVVDIRNQRAVQPLAHPKISAGGYRHLFIFEQEANGVWRYFGMTGLRGSGGAVITWIRGSYLNRAIALFRYVSGVPMEKEPPAAR